MVIVLFAVMLGGVAMVAWALLRQDRETMTAGVGLLTVALPVSLLVVGLVFGQRSEKRLNALTEQVLDKLIPHHLEQIVGAPCKLQVCSLGRAGCRATYQLTPSNASATDLPLKFSVELNVRKVNVMFGLPQHWDIAEHRIEADSLTPYRHVIAGATAEGYHLNEQLAHYAGEDGGSALLFFKKLPEDFLLRPIEKLYFVQDLAFFVRGMVEAQRAQASDPQGGS